ncbi:hypothetical protein N7499_008958 [Penicillium canescens]|uniref:N-acetyltransferase domain-containing protein n=1 Tax=Penicillium canescens TaxID=5083 RepID=A0AAD6N2R5_PENCN|nr:hypothetical protein N7460_013955 [Penicillium canescens]KAJ6025163.1 hypothetical protein N7444_012842 [Penicillium canescens]KAJ6076977.1 hypothetical protein N7499_008958 [Penicillium canescens]KAJ6159288.1 hypothetical protein N7485_012114 [Penicillium canescens]
MSSGKHDIGLRIEPINQRKDMIQAFNCACEAFGRQAQDGVWIAMNPAWETPAGKARGAAAMVNRWTTTTKDQDGNPNTIFLKATLPSSQGGRVIAGFAIWVQASSVAGRGDKPAEDLRDAMELESLHVLFFRRRTEVIKEKATATPPAVMILDMCAVDPRYQRKGIARALVQWGLDEAQRRGDLEAITEASSMGRHVYGQMGFHPEGPEIEYHVDPEFSHRSRPANLFMRTGGGSE